MNVDRIGDPQTLTSIILLLVIGGLLSCDTVSPEQKNEQKNPYADFVDTYSDAASASLKYVREQRPTDRKQVRQLLAQGYRQWVDRNESRAESSFGQFQELEAVQRSVQKHLSRSPRAKRKELLSVDSLLAIADLTTDQQIQFKKLFATLEGVNSYSELNSSLTRFENRSRNELGRGSRKVVLQISALIRAQSKFIAEADSTTNVSMAYLAAIGDSTASRNCKDHGSLETSRDCERGLSGQRYEPVPLARNYVNMTRVALAAGTAALTGGTAFFNASCGPYAPVCATLLGGAAGFGVGVLEFQAQVRDYQMAVRRWCRKPCSRYHPNHLEVCREAK